MTKIQHLQKLFEHVTWPYNSIHNSVHIEFDENDAIDTKLATLRDIKERLDDLYSAYIDLENYVDSQIENAENELYHN